MERIDYDRMAAIYDEGRAFPAEWLEGWRDAVRRYIDGIEGPVLDIGSGTGIWSLLLAEWFDVEVIGIEPSSGMRSVAAENRQHLRVHYVGGNAEHLPLTDSSCAAVWMSTVVHHISDLVMGAREVRRVLKKGGPLLIRNAFSGRHDDVLWTRFFPSALRIAEKRHPSIDATVAAFSSGGFTKELLRSVSEMSASSLHEYADRVATRADSTLTLISDEEFEQGLRALRKAAATEEARPVATVLDLLVLR